MLEQGINVNQEILKENIINSVAYNAANFPAKITPTSSTRTNLRSAQDDYLMDVKNGLAGFLSFIVKVRQLSFFQTVALSRLPC